MVLVTLKWFIPFGNHHLFDNVALPLQTPDRHLCSKSCNGNSQGDILTSTNHYIWVHHSSRPTEALQFACYNQGDLTLLHEYLRYFLEERPTRWQGEQSGSLRIIAKKSQLIAW
jgi:hypothetical protein